MNAVQIFNNPNFGQIRTLEVNNQPYFVGNDIALALGYAKPRNAILQHVDNEDALKQGIPDNQGFTQETTLINESGVYSLVFGSKLPTAKAFKRWITSEVLPAIRKTGGYIATKQGDTSEEIMARALVIAQNTIMRRDERMKLLEKEIDAQSAQISNLTPKAEFADCFLSCKGDITIGELANILNQSCLFSKGRNKLREWLRKNGYLIKRGTRKNKPTQKSMSLHLMRIASTLCNTGEKNVFREEVMVTARGQKHFITQFRALLSSKESYEIEW